MVSDNSTESTVHRSKKPALKQSGKFRPLRIWPAVVLMVAMFGSVIASRVLPAMFEDESMALMLVTMLGPAVLGLGVLIWWVTFSRATWLERIVGLVGTLLVAGLAMGVSNKTVLGPAIIMITVPMGTAAFAVGAILFRRQLSFKRTWLIILIASCGFGFTALLRSDGMWAHGVIDWHWRWEASAEEQMLAERAGRSAGSQPEISNSEMEAWLANPEWPRFRGHDGLSTQHGSKIAVDWETRPPEQIWRIPVGPGWSSFAVAGNLLFTQEQHGENETIVCYAADSGQEIWTRPVESRFFDPVGGPGPRATPTLADGALFAQGAEGLLQRLDPLTGEVVWIQDLRKVANREPPTWGFASSPLVTGDVVIVHAGGKGDKGTLAFDIDTGELRWSAAAGDHTYCSPQSCTIAGKPYVLMLTNTGINVLDPESGRQLLGYEWKYSGYRALQPQVIDGDSILLPTGPGSGTRRIRITDSNAGLQAEELWTSRNLKPDFNDFVVFENHAYGFDGTIFTCIDLQSGERKWKRGRYGKGQVLLLADSGILLVASEYGDVVLLNPDPDGHEEITRFQALEGKTWNHPVVIGDRLYIRNAQEAACYRLPLDERTSTSQINLEDR